MSEKELLQHLLLEATKSNCDKIKFGAAAINSKREIIAWGHNHNPYRIGFSCAKTCIGGIRKGIKSGTCAERCYAIHAEQHALIQAGSEAYEIAVAGLLPNAELFDNGGGFYCTVCARMMVAAGIEWVSIWSKGKRVRLPMEEAWEQSYKLVKA